jgi:hypothetical protein
MVALFQLAPLNAHAENLGLTLQIIQGQSSKSGIEDNTRLWFVIEPGSSKSRRVIVKSTSNVAEKVSISIGAVKRVNGESQLALGEVSQTKQWATFSEQNFILSPRGEKEISVGFSIPKSENVNSYAAMLLVKATSLQSTSKTLEYSVPGAAQIAAPIFLGVGTEDEFITSFEIKSVSGKNTVQGKSLRVEIKNSGKTPVSIQGDVQAMGLTFKTGTVGPFYYQTETIAPGETKFADALVGESISESKWKIYVTATQGQVTESREFEVEVNYSGSVNLFSLLLKIIIPLAFLLLLYWSFQVLRSSRVRKVAQIAEVTNPERKIELPDLTDEQIQQLIQEFGGTSAKKRPVKQAVQRKAPARKAAKKPVAKSAPAKKAARKPAKKIANKPPVKSATKKKTQSGRSTV